MGVTPRYLVAVWTGNASGEGRPGLTGARTSARVMFDLFNLLPQTAWFDIPYNELTEAAICRESGLLQGSYCPESSIDTLLIPHKGMQGNSCGYHKRIHLSQDGQYQVYQQCAGSRGIMPVSWFVLPPSWAWYYKQQHPLIVRFLHSHPNACREDRDNPCNLSIPTTMPPSNSPNNWMARKAEPSSNWRIKTLPLQSIGTSITIILARLPMCIKWSYRLAKASIG